MGAFWAGYLIFFGTTFAFGFSDMVPNREPYHVMNGIAFGQSSHVRYIKTKRSFDICYTIEENTHKLSLIHI